MVGRRIGHIVTKETREKISLKNKGRKKTEEQKSKMSKLAQELGFGKWMAGKKLKEETKLKISKSNSGDKAYQWKGGLPNCPVCGKKLSAYLSKGCQSCSRKGEKNAAWKGGVTPVSAKERNSIEARLWRESVFARDNWTCQKYGIRGGRLRAHHIQNFSQYPKLRFAIDNGITLSEKAHREFHRRYGVKNNTKEQMAEFIQLSQVEVA